jgi:uncharacterized protein (DUF2062 family)
MEKKKGIEKFFGFFKTIYVKLFIINDTPQKIAWGFSVGVFSGILPGTGPLAALFLALVFRVNRAAALLGCLLTNTWLSVVTFLFSIKIGAMVLGLHWQQVHADYQHLLSNFHWADVARLSIFKMLLPVIIGYCIVSLFCALAVYCIVILALTCFKPRNQKS